MSCHKRLNVVAAIIQNDGKIFATQREYGEFKDGWEFPGGKVKDGETLQEAWKREIREELDTDDTVPGISRGKYKDHGGRKVLNMSLEINHRFIDGYYAG